MTWHENAGAEGDVGPIAVHGREVVKARGYSLHELSYAGLTQADARHAGLPVDPDRMTMIGANVMQLRSWSASNRRSV